MNNNELDSENQKVDVNTSSPNNNNVAQIVSDLQKLNIITPPNNYNINEIVTETYNTFKDNTLKQIEDDMKYAIDIAAQDKKEYLEYKQKLESEEEADLNYAIQETIAEAYNYELDLNIARTILYHIV